MARSSSSPPREPPEGDHDGWATASEWSNGGGALGFGRRWQEAARLLGFGHGGGAAARGALNSLRMHPGKRARGERRRGHGRRVGLGPLARSRCGRQRSERDDGWGPPVSGCGGCARGEESGPRWAGKDGWAAGLVVGCGRRWAKREKKGGVKREGFLFIFFQTHSNNEFIPEFEFKHNKKMMHQHVCNRELLYFIIKLRKVIKCL
jgi:hypothetical protein